MRPEDSVDPALARYAALLSRGMPTEVGVVHAADSERTIDFVSGELLVDARDEDLLQELVERYGARVHPPPDVPPPPPEVGEGAMHLLEEAPRLPWTVELPPDLAERDRDLPNQLGHVLPGAAASSARAVAAAGVVAAYADRRRRPQLNVLGRTSGALPMEAPTDVGAADTGFQDRLTEMMTQMRILEAWQLIDSVRTFRPLKQPLWVAVLDSGFGFTTAGIPTSADLAGAAHFHLGTQSSAPFGERGVGRNGEGQPTPFHGHQVASAAVAAVGNATEVAGSGGTVARAFCFHMNPLSQKQALYAVKCCYAWALDVLNISVAFTVGWGDSIIDGWEEQFDFADRHGVVVVASAGNSGKYLPDEAWAYPATRTPGVITVGALEADGVTRWGSSNHGPSVNVWASGVDVPVVPDPGQTNLQSVNGTSVASPLVAGVAAMMKSVHPALTSTRAREILHETGVGGPGDSAYPRLDAVAAVWEALSQAMAPDMEEGNESPATARPLSMLAPGRLGPAAASMASTSVADQDWWSFELNGYTAVRIELDWYRRLAAQLNPQVTSDSSPGAERSAAGLVRRQHPTGVTLTGTLAPGTYRIGVKGTGPTAYRLVVTTTPSPLPPDEFEPNDSLETAALMLLEASADPWAKPLRGRWWGPGAYEATLPARSGTVDVDYFRFDTGTAGFWQPTVEISDSDLPVHVELLGADGSVARSWPDAGGSPLVVELASDTTSYLRVSADRETRYRIRTGMRWREGIPREWEEQEVLPQWWLDPPEERLRDRTSWVVDLGRDGRDPMVSFQVSPGVEIAIRTPDGSEQVVAADESGRIDVDLSAVGHAAALLTARGQPGSAAGRVVQVAPKIARLRHR